jgi:putative transposase
MTLSKNAAISESLRKTREKRLSQECRVFKIKIDESALKKEQKEALKMQFVEAKWIVNEAIAAVDLFKYVAGKSVVHRDKDGNEVISKIKYLGSQMKQAVVDELKSNVKTLSSLKKTGKKVGKLKFRREIKSINLKQYGTTYRIVNKHKIKIQNIPGEIRANGLGQIFSSRNKLKYELANAKLLNTPLGYFIAITCFSKKKERKCEGEIGLDFGISTTLTLSDGRKFDAFVQETDRLKRLQRKLSRQEKGSKRRWKTLWLIKKEYQKLANRKNDIANKICAEILKFKDIYMQDENLSGWKSRFGKKVQHSVLGRIKSKIKPKAKYVLSRWEPTTKLCVECGQLHMLSLEDRVFTCDCGVSDDRDVHAAKNMVALSKIKIGQELSELTLAETSSDSSRCKTMRAEVVETRRSEKVFKAFCQEDAASLA